MTATIEETDERTDLSGFEVPEIPCEHQRHDEHGTGAAVWAVYFIDPVDCGCSRAHNPALLCDGCWRYLSRTGQVRCVRCDVLMDLSGIVIKVMHL